VLALLLSRSGPRPFAVGGLLGCAVALAALAWCASMPDAHPAGIVLALLVFGIAQYATWLALVGQATADVEPRQYGVASGVFKTSTHVGAPVAVAVFATTIDVLGGEATGGGPYAAAYLGRRTRRLRCCVQRIADPRYRRPTPRSSLSVPELHGELNGVAGQPDQGTQAERSQRAPAPPEHR
jgi:hypothetical protein